MPLGKISKKREKQINYFKNVDKYKKDHGKSPAWGPKQTKKVGGKKWGYRFPLIQRRLRMSKDKNPFMEKFHKKNMEEPKKKGGKKVPPAKKKDKPK